MAVKVRQVDGRGSDAVAGVTTDNLAMTGHVEPSAFHLTDPQLQRHRYLSEALTDANDSGDLTVDGSTTPVEFTLQSRPGVAIWCTGIRIILNGDNFEIDTNDARRFGSATVANAPLPNGLEMEVHQGGRILPIFAAPVTRLIEFLNYARLDTFTNLRNAITNSSDFFACEFTFPRPIVLVPKNADKIVLRVSDDLTPIDLFQVFATGHQEFE